MRLLPQTISTGFGGNMWRQASKKAGPAMTAAAAIEFKRAQENMQKNYYADRQTKEASKNEGFKDPNERAGYHKDRRDEWVQESGTITKLEKIVGNWWDSFS